MLREEAVRHLVKSRLRVGVRVNRGGGEGWSWGWAWAWVWLRVRVGVRVLVWFRVRVGVSEEAVGHHVIPVDLERVVHLVRVRVRGWG